jgi:5-formyltetrahydrofolate cyclo-ligase
LKKLTTEIEQIDWGHWILRLVALIIDEVLLTIVLGIFAVILAVATIISGGIGFIFAGFGFLIFWLILGVLAVLYFTVFDSYWGGTIGKRVMGLRVQMLNGDKVPLEKSLIRNLSKFFGLVIIDWLIGILTPGDKRQKFSDRYAGTIVVQSKQAFGSVPPPPPPPT